MAREDVNIKVSADVAEAIRMWRAMQEGPQAMARELEATGRSGKRAQNAMTKSANGPAERRSYCRGKSAHCQAFKRLKRYVGPP